MTRSPDSIADHPITRSRDAWALSIYVFSRLVGLAILLLVADTLYSRHLAAGTPFHLWHNVFDRWDVYFYRTIARGGYPRTLPTDATGAAVTNPWAFFPAFPFAVGAIQWITGAGFERTAVALNIAAGAVTAVLLSRLTARVSDDRAARGAVALWSFFPTSFVLNVPYAEAVYLAIASGFLLALVERRLLVAAACLVAAGLSRGYTLPLSAAALVVCVQQWRARRTEPKAVDRTIPRRESAADVAALAAAAVSSPVIWPAVAALVTGRLDAYTATQHVWGYSINPLDAIAEWRDTIGELGSGRFPVTATLSLLGVAVVALLSVRTRLPAALKAYTLTAAVFLLAIAQPRAVGFGSTPRFAFGIVTLPVVLAICLENAVAMGVCLAAFIALQYFWVLNIWSGRLGLAP